VSLHERGDGVTCLTVFPAGPLRPIAWRGEPKTG